MLAKPIKKIVKMALNKMCFSYMEYFIKSYYIVLNFHQVTENYDPQYHIKGTWTDINEFEKLIIKLKNIYKIIPLSEGINIIKNNKVTDKFLSISFDDGDISIMKVVPILKKFNIPATFFINSAYLSNKEYSYQVLRYFAENKITYEKKLDYLINNFSLFRNTIDQKFYNNYRNTFLDFRTSIKENIKLVIDEDYLFKLNDPLFEIGLHGHEHERFGMMPIEWQLNDLKTNMEILSSYKNYRPIFAIPFGKPWDWDYNTIRIALELKLDFIFHDSGINIKKEVGLKRIPADGRSFNDILFSSLFA